MVTCWSNLFIKGVVTLLGKAVPPAARYSSRARVERMRPLLRRCRSDPDQPNYSSQLLASILLQLQLLLASQVTQLFLPFRSYPLHSYQASICSVEVSLLLQQMPSAALKDQVYLVPSGVALQANGRAETGSPSSASATRVALWRGTPDLNHVYFENRSFSSSGSRRSLVQRRSATTKGSWFRRASKSATRRVRSSAQAWQW